MKYFFLFLLGLLILDTPSNALQPAESSHWDIVILQGRVMDPETGFDQIANVGLKNGRIGIITTEPIKGDRSIVARNMVVAPGFIDANTYTLVPAFMEILARDGVTAALNLEQGAVQIDDWYKNRDKKSLIHYGTSVAFNGTRMIVTDDPKAVMVDGRIDNFETENLANSPLDEAQLENLLSRLERGLRQGAVAVGVGIEYAPGAKQSEILAVAELAARYNASIQLHAREWDGALGDRRDLYEAVALWNFTGVKVQFSHLNSSAGIGSSLYSDMIIEARSRGADIFTECYPYAAGMTGIESSIFEKVLSDWSDEEIANLEWPPTGERLTRETFPKYRAQGGMVIIHKPHHGPVIVDCLKSPVTTIASDGSWEGGSPHPRAAGTHARILGQYVRKQRVLSLMDAIGKMAYLPAVRLTPRIPQMKYKGRLQVGMDADLTIFDPATVMDQATYAAPIRPSKGIPYVLVNGTIVVDNSQIVEKTFPGKPIRAQIKKP